jgi:predicted dehydrogenase
MSCLTHQIDALRWYGGDVDAVTCMTKVVPERMEGETFGVVTARMKSGALAQLSINWMTRSAVDVLSDTGPRALWYEMVQVCGTRGEAYYMSGRGTFVMSHDGADLGSLFECEGPIPEGSFARLRTVGGPGHGRCVQEWIKLIRGEPSGISSTGREGRAAVEVAEAAYLSEGTGAHVTLPIEPRPW